MSETPLPGGNLGGAHLVDGTVRRRTGFWSPAVHALLRHLEDKEFPGAPRFLGVDDRGREILTYLVGDTVGDVKPWPSWVHADESLDQVARWLRSYHQAVADFTPPPSTTWRFGGSWSPELVIGHNDTAPYNAVWRDSALVGFFDWDLAAPVSREWDLAYVAFSWVPLHARSVVAGEGFTDFVARPARLRRLLKQYGWEGETTDFLLIVKARVIAMVESLRVLAAGGDSDATRLLDRGVAENCERAVLELDEMTF